MLSLFLQWNFVNMIVLETPLKYFHFLWCQGSNKPKSSPVSLCAIIVFVSVCGLAGDTVSAAHPAAVAESDADSEESRVGATDTKTDVRGQSISSCTILWM